jgi:hypothetical protein
VAEKPYSRVYHRLMTEYPSVWRSPSQLGMWLQMLVLAEKFYPDWPIAPRKDRVYRALVGTGLVIEKDGGCYTMKGLEAERERRAASGRIGAAKRWDSERNAKPMLDETRRDENRQEGGNGKVPTTYMGWKPRVERAPGEAVPLVHDGKHRGAETCMVCNPQPLPREGVDL